MKKIWVYFLLLLFVVMLCACQTMSTIKENILYGSSGFYVADPAKMAPDSNLAIATVDVAKLGLLKSFPYARIGPRSKIKLENKTDYYKFRQLNLVVVEDFKAPDGTRTLGMLCESVDDFGRIDLSKNRIVFKPEEPNKKEAAAIRRALSRGSKGAAKLKNKQLRNDLKKRIAEYQQARGLTPDGVAGGKTIESLAREMPVLDVQELTTQVIRRQRPQTILYVLPLETVAKNKKEFSGGFKSMERVKKHDISADDFRRLAKPGQEFVLFVYFLDRVNPAYSIRLNFAPSPLSQTRFLTPVRYAAPEKWPVLVESFKLDDIEDPTASIFVNVLVDGKRVGSHSIH